MTGFEKIKERVSLRNEYYKKTGNSCENSQGEPDLDYVIWLELKAIDKCTGCPESTGETKLFCCNHCGKRTEDF